MSPHPLPGGAAELGSAHTVAPSAVGGDLLLKVVCAYFGSLLAFLSTGALSVDQRTAAGSWAMLIGYVAVGVALSRYDLLERRLPDTLTLPLAAGLIGATNSLTITAGTVGETLTALCGGLGLAAVLFVLGMAGAVGFGDVKLALAIGVLTGWHAWYAPAAALALSWVLALPHALYGVHRRRQGRPLDDVPFGPYLLLSGGLVAAYFALLG